MTNETKFYLFFQSWKTVEKFNFDYIQQSKRAIIKNPVYHKAENFSSFTQILQKKNQTLKWLQIWKIKALKDKAIYHSLMLVWQNRFSFFFTHKYLGLTLQKDFWNRIVKVKFLHDESVNQEKQNILYGPVE